MFAGSPNRLAWSLAIRLGGRWIGKLGANVADYAITAAGGNTDGVWPLYTALR